MADTHVELPGSFRAAPLGAQRIRDVDSSAHIEITVTLKGPDLPGWDAMPEKALTAAEVAQRYGVPDKTVQTVEQVLRGYHLDIHQVTQGGRSLRVGGPASAIVAAFRPNLAIYQIPGQGEVRGREGPLMVPRALDGLISGVDGLDERRMARRHGPAAAAAAVPATTLKPLTPADLQTRYQLPAGNGAGQTIAIAEFGTQLSNGHVLPPAYISSDVAAFCARHGLPTPTVRVEPVNIAPLSRAQYRLIMQQNPGLRDALFGMTAETMMDVQIIAALCPAADIGVYFASWDQKGWIDLLDDITSGSAKRPVAVSISYGLAEDASDWSQGAMRSINHRLQIAAMQGITVCVSSGDDGTSCQMAGKRARVAFPGCSPFVLSVGGTMLTQGPGGQVDEVVWWESPGRRTSKGGGATGGGVAANPLNPRPPWQTVKVPSLNPGAQDGRVVPDVAALAGFPLYDLLLDGQVFPDGGTSASAPLWASLVARMDAAWPAAKRQRFLPPLLYKPGVAAAGFRDIVHGDNTSHPSPGIGYKAGPGFDAVSGWGVPKGVALANALK